MWRMLLFCLLVAGCAAAPSYNVDRFTGMAVARSGYDVIDVAGLSRFEAEAAVLRHGGDAEYLINIAVTRADRNYPKITAVWVPGREINYVTLDERKILNSRQEVGYIRLNRTIFEIAARDGFDLRLISPRGGHAGRIPARLFRAALSEAASDRT